MNEEERIRAYPLEDAILAREQWYHYRPPQGESGKDVEIRLLSFLDTLRDRNVFIVGHGKANSFMARLLTNEPLQLDCDYQHQKNCELWKFTHEDTGYYRKETLFLPK